MTNHQSIDFDHHSAEFAEDPWGEMAKLRTGCPVAFSEQYGGFWVISKYEDIKAIARDDVTFSSANSIVIPPKKNVGQQSIPIEMDPPEYLTFRRLMHPMLSPAAIDRLTPTIDFFVNRCIDTFIEAGEVDFVNHLADPVPSLTTLHKLGVPLEMWSRFSEPMHKVVFLRQDNPLHGDAVRDLSIIRTTLKETMEARKESPRDDMVSYLLNCEIDGRRVSDGEVLEMLTLMIQGGLDTTGSSISNALGYLDRNPSAREQLIADPSLIPTAIEEFLRYEAPQIALARTATRDVQIGENDIKKGDRVLLLWASANRDEDAFDNPEEVRFDRFPNRHMTFGVGGHRCLGSNLARREIEIVIRSVLRRLPDYQIDWDRAARPETVGITYGMFDMPATFTPGERWSPPDEDLSVYRPLR